MVGKLKWVLAGVAAVVVLVVGGTWVYLNVVRDDPPERLTFDAGPEPLDDSTTTMSSPSPQVVSDDGAEADPVSGTWVPTDDSVVGYRVGEVLFGQRTEGVGRTNEIAGEVVIDGLTVRSVEFEVDMASVTSDESRRDNQFRGRIMDVENHPTATLRLVDPIELDGVPDDGEVVQLTASVELTLRGTARVVPVSLQARRNGPLLEVNGTIDVVFEEWGIPNPSTVGITTDDHGDLEFLVVLARA